MQLKSFSRTNSFFNASPLDETHVKERVYTRDLFAKDFEVNLQNLSDALLKESA